ncbi:hypothetical protein LX70_02658 [Defluviimonas denitrificans]|jgi:hypothetical protein|uniref:Holin (3TMs family) n=1 Tax=Albidovulum denitrificans TaxID=404881 RepID=A0A2S8S6H6_9RHOB|nr:hypothetical protein [Defluviimonas denitrificans]PQV56392.1 hypothetical protein LX70_02658 [Defluviimonas denitrificans]
MVPALIALAAQVGVPIIRDILARKIGEGNAQLATDVIGVVARHAGVAPDQLEQLAVDEPGKVMTAMVAAEPEVAELVPLYMAELAARQETYRMEAEDPLWARAWRPLGMYGLGFIWLWNLVILHVANAIWKTALPPTDLGILLQLSALYMSLYMGGHTAKDLMAKWTGRR